MNALLETLKRAYAAVSGYIAAGPAAAVLKSVSGIIVLYAAYKILSVYLRRLLQPRVSRPTLLLAGKALRYTFVVVGVLYVFRLFGINVNAVLGAAGIAGVAVGFASQTSVSNIISGFFLLSEKTLKIGDFIDVGGMTGTVDSINLLSIKLKTPDNQMARVPNETIIKSNLLNYSTFPLRRFQLRVQVSYNADLKGALDTLLRVPEACGEVILSDPAPAVFVDSFDDSGITLVLNAWFKREDLLPAKNALFTGAKRLFGEAGIEIPFPQLDVRVASEPA